MDSIFTSLLSSVLLYKYGAIFLITYLAAVIVPIPANTSVLLAASFAAQGFLNIYFVSAAAILGNILGDLTGYGIARLYGKALLEKIPFMRRLFESAQFKKAEKRLAKEYAPLTIFVTRFSAIFSPLTNIVAGIAEIPFLVFLPYDILGETANTLLFILVGYFLGIEAEAVTDAAALFVFAAAFTWISIVTVRHYRKRRSADRQDGRFA